MHPMQAGIPALSCHHAWGGGLGLPHGVTTSPPESQKSHCATLGPCRGTRSGFNPLEFHGSCALQDGLLKPE